jgi:purine-binding chemotaxis protein CheW
MRDQTESLDERPPPGQLYATFVVEDVLFGLDVLAVQEVLRYQDTTPVPTADPIIEGLINLRGQIVTAIDLRRRLGFPPRPEGQRAMNVIVRSDGSAVSLQVDAIGEVLETDPEAYEGPPETLDHRIRHFTQGIYKLKDRILLVLDKERVTHLAGPGKQAAAGKHVAALAQ